MIELKNSAEIEKMRKSAAVVARVLKKLKEAGQPGVTTAKLDEIARGILKKEGARAAFLGYRDFPAAACVSINYEVVHGIPSQKRKLKEGDIVSVDFGVELNGYYGDAALTFGVGKVSGTASRLMEVTRSALHCGIKMAGPGNRLGDISSAVQAHVEKNGFSVVRDFVGHGIGRQLHEDPMVPNFGKPGTGPELRAGMVLAIEPMVNEKGHEIIVKDDEWTVETKDKGLSAHFEHDVAITENGPEILSK